MTIQTNSIKKKSWVVFGFLLTFIFFSTDGFNKVGWDGDFGRHIMIAFYLLIMLISYLQRKKIKIINMPMRKFIIALTIIPILCIVTRMYAGDMGFDTITPYMASVTFLVYFILHEYNVPEKVLISCLTKIALIIFLIQVVQQVMPSSAVFGVSDPNSYFYNGEMAEVRNGLYRYRIVCFIISLIALYHSWQAVNEKRNIRTLSIFVALACSVYLYLTRQLMFTSIVTIACSFIFMKQSKGKLLLLISVAIFLFVIYSYSDVLFGELLTQTKDENTSDNIRMLSLAFYWDKIVGDPLSFFFGNGIHPQLQYWGRMYYFWPTDIGIFGAWFFYGVFEVITYLLLVWNILVRKSSKLPLYIKLFVFGTFINCFMIFPYLKAYEYIVWAIVLYICDLHIVDNKKTNRIKICIHP